MNQVKEYEFVIAVFTCITVYAHVNNLQNSLPYIFMLITGYALTIGIYRKIFILIILSFVNVFLCLEWIKYQK